MATVINFASCYGRGQDLQLFGRGPRGGSYLALLSHRVPRFTPRPRLSHHPPRMTLRQICHMLKMMKQVRKREAAAAAAAASSRKQGSTSPTPSLPGSNLERKCAPTCLRRKRSIKRAG